MPPDTEIIRYSNRKFPEYAYVPGQHPHPTRDEAGHSYNQHPEALPEFASDQWHDCESWLYGVDLFNYHYWWEAHEAFEAVWVAAGRQTETGYFIQGIIQIAVAHLKYHQEFIDVAQRMAEAGLDKMNSIHGIYMGINTEQLREDTRNYFQMGNGQPVKLILHFEVEE